MAIPDLIVCARSEGCKLCESLANAMQYNAVQFHHKQKHEAFISYHMQRSCGHEWEARTEHRRVPAKSRSWVMQWQLRDPPLWYGKGEVQQSSTNSIHLSKNDWSARVVLAAWNSEHAASSLFISSSLESRRFEGRASRWKCAWL